MGRIHVDVESCFEASNSADVIAVDRFHIVGPDTPSPLDLTVKLHCVGGGACNASLREGIGSPEFDVPFVWNGSETTLELHVQHAVGEEFVIQYAAWTSVVPFSGGGALSCALSFEGLPAGYSIVSCSGYPSTVATLPTTWGTFKQGYR